MNVPRMFTAFNQSCPVHFILSYLLLCKIIHIFNFIFSFNFFINQVIKIFTTPLFFLLEIQSNFKSVLFALSFSCTFITETSALFPASTLMSTILYIHTQKTKFFDHQSLFFIFYFFGFFIFYFLFFIFFIFYCFLFSIFLNL